MAALREGNMTSDLDEPAMVDGEELLAGGDTERLREVVGRDFPFLKNGTFNDSVDAMAVVEEMQLTNTNTNSDGHVEVVISHNTSRS